MGQLLTLNSGDKPQPHSGKPGHWRLRHQTLIKFLHLNFVTLGLNIQSCRYFESLMTYQLIYEDDHLIAVNKPSKLLSVPGLSEPHNLFDMLKQRFPSART